MKKTLIALAAVAVSSAAMAQVTVSGKLQFDQTSATTAAGVKTTQSDMNGGDVRFSAAEDLGNGLKASAYGEIALRGRNQDAGVRGRNAAITLSGGFGSITAGSVAAGNGIAGLGQAGAPVIGFDNTSKILDGETNVNAITYTLPALVPGLGLSLATMNVTGSTREAATINQIAATYTLGGLSLAADRSMYSKNKDVAAADGSIVATAGATALLGYAATTALTSGQVVVRAAVAASGAPSDRTRISAMYDLGVAKIGYGVQTINYKTVATYKANTQTVMGVSVPLGAITLGASAASNKTDGDTTKTSGTEYGASYALSKRTSVAVAAQSYKKTGEAATKATRVRLSHSF